MEERRPSVANANRRRKGAFSSLLEQALTDLGALDALVFAYEALPTAERLGMAQAVVQDAQRPGPALAALLAVETEPGLRARVTEMLRAHTPGSVVFVSGTHASGEALLRDVGPTGLEASLRIRWDDHEITDLEIKTKEDPRFCGEAVSHDAAMDLVAPMLWRHLRRGGSLPSGVERFARLF
jgi:hypothetical protein